jgi:hypothetical protein
MTLVVHINGWPGSGKLTIGRVLAMRLDARLPSTTLGALSASAALCSRCVSPAQRNGPVSSRYATAAAGRCAFHLTRAALPPSVNV